MDPHAALSSFPSASLRRLRVAVALVMMLALSAAPDQAVAAGSRTAVAPTAGSASTSSAAAPASANGASTATTGDEDLPRWVTPAFWKGTAGAAIGGAIGAKLLGWGPVLSALSQIAKLSPFAALVARPVIPVLAGAIGAQIASSSLTHADWGMVAAQTVAGALGTAASLLIAPGAGAIGPWIGQVVGVYAGTWVLSKWRKHLESQAGASSPTIAGATPGANAGVAPSVAPAAAASIAAGTAAQGAVTGRLAAPAIAVPVIHGASASDIAVAYERWRSAKGAGIDADARQAYSGVVSALSH